MEMWFGGFVVWLFSYLVVWLIVKVQENPTRQPTPHDLAGSQYRAQRE